MAQRRWLPLWPVAAMVVSSTVLIVFWNSPLYEGIKWIGGIIAIVLGLAVTGRAATQRRVPARERRPWQFLLGYWILSLITNILFFIAFGGGKDAAPNPALLLPGAIAWVLQGLPMLLALLSFPMRPMTRPERIRFGLDMAIVCGGGFIPMWIMVLVPAIGHTVGSAKMITIAQPVEHLVLVFAVCAVMLRGGLTSLRHPLTFVLGGQVMLVAGVVGVGYELVRHGVAVHALPLDLLMQNGAYLLVLGAATQVRGVGRDSHRATGGGSRRPALLPYVALGLGYAVLVSAAAGSRAWIGLIMGALTMTGAVAVRQVIALRENHNFLVRDGLTGLSSRMALYDNLDRTVERSARTGRPAAVLLIDLNGFKRVNDRLGHAAGDELLVAFGQVLTGCIRSGDTAGRLGGDEFAVVLPDVTDIAAAVKVAESIVTECAKPFTAAGQSVTVGASIGVSITEAVDMVSAAELLRRADVAMYRIKRQRGAQHVLVYDLSMDLEPESVPVPQPLPGLDTDELAELDRLRRRVDELEHKGVAHASR